MEMHITAEDMRARGYPPLALRLEGEDFSWSLFPGPGTIASVEGPFAGLPCLHIRIAKGTVRDRRGVEAFASDHFGAELVALGVEPGPTGMIPVGGQKRPALGFFGRRRRGEPVAGCLAVIPAGDATILLLCGTLGTRLTRPSPQAVAGDEQLAALLETFTVETGALDEPRLIPE
jgi:hypothetical protein